MSNLDQNFSSANHDVENKNGNSKLHEDNENIDLTAGLLEGKDVAYKNFLAQLENLGVSNYAARDLDRVFEQIYKSYVLVEDPRTLQFGDRVIIIFVDPKTKKAGFLTESVKYSNIILEGNTPTFKINTFRNTSIKFIYNSRKDIPDQFASDEEIDDVLRERAKRWNLVIYRRTQEAQNAISHFYGTNGPFGIFGKQQGYKNSYLDSKLPKEDRMTKLELFRALTRNKNSIDQLEP